MSATGTVAPGATTIVIGCAQLELPLLIRFDLAVTVRHRFHPPRSTAKDVL